MFFNSIVFVIFFTAVLLLLQLEHAITRERCIRNLILLVSSYFFYGYFNIGFLILLVFISVINYVGGRCIYKGVYRKWTLGGCIILSLLPLVFYKYALFLWQSMAWLLNLEIQTELLNGILLPVGISFFTFQALSYPIDLYRGKIEKPAGLLDFLLFVSFFPTILSGPIEKARNLLPQLQAYRSTSLSDITQGISIFVWGLFKKVVVADRLAEYVNWAYATADYQSRLTLICAAVFYSFQIYCDFSGYSDMALGVAKGLGFDITKNFKQPYLSKTFKEFWRKWHIALTSWFTEYVYFSLGGSRVNHKLRWVFNISMVFILSGIWHGAAWSFVIWGVLHAVYYLIEHFLGLQSEKVKWNAISSLLSGFVVFALVTLAWIFFRLDFNHACNVIARIFTAGGGLDLGSSSFSFACTVLMLGVLFVYELLIRHNVVSYDVQDYEQKQGVSLLSVVPLLIMIGLFGVSSSNFVYFQF